MHKSNVDTEFLEGLRRGDAAVIRRIYEQCADKVRAWVVANSGTSEEARDVFQEGIESMYTLVGDPDFQLRSSFEGLLITICKRNWYGVLRSKKRWQSIRNSEDLTPESEIADAETLLIQLEEQTDRDRRLASTFSRLSELCRRVLQLYAAGKQPEAIAETLNMSGRNAVYQRRKACADRWKELMSQMS